jgi:hypothetical protein
MTLRSLLFRRRAWLALTVLALLACYNATWGWLRASPSSSAAINISRSA